MMRRCWFCGRLPFVGELVTVGGVPVWICRECDEDLDDSAAADRQAVYAHMRDEDRRRWEGRADA